MRKLDNTTLVSLDLDDRIAAAFSDWITSSDTSALIVEVQSAALASGEAAEQARQRALDPALSKNAIGEARQVMEATTFRRDRLQTAVTKLQARLKEVTAQEENDHRKARYAEVKAERDRLAAELADTYPAIERQLVDLFTRLDANDSEIKQLNLHLPAGEKRLLVAELLARGLTSFLKDATQIERMTEQLRLPAFERPVHRHPFSWPPSR
jgi:hypothetical protein